MSESIKFSEGKLPIQEIDWNFIIEMLEVMQYNKSKYPPENWKKKMDKPEELLHAATRHLLQVLTGNLIDISGHSHLPMIALNCMMYAYQLKFNQPEDWNEKMC